MDLGPVVKVAIEVGFVLKALLDKRSFRVFKSGRANARVLGLMLIFVKILNAH